MSAPGPACVKTRASRECAELFSPFSSFDCDCQCGSFPIQRNRDKSSTRKFDVGVFTQAGSFPDLGTRLDHVRLTPISRHGSHASKVTRLAVVLANTVVGASVHEGGRF